jgi:hypothetical protein
VTVTAPETTVRARLIALLEKEFEDDGVTIRSDRLHESLGTEAPVGGVYPAQAGENPKNGVILESTVHVQLFRRWTAEVNPKQAVDPGAIEEWAERLRRACQDDNEAVGDKYLWFYSVIKVEYPPDPSGNISRLLATVLARAQNPALVETTG